MDQRDIPIARSPVPIADWPGFAGALGVFAFLSVVFWQVESTRRARLGHEQDKAYAELTTKYSDLVDRYVDLQLRTVEGLSRNAVLGDVDRGHASPGRLAARLDGSGSPAVSLLRRWRPPGDRQCVPRYRVPYDSTRPATPGQKEGLPTAGG